MRNFIQRGRKLKFLSNKRANRRVFGKQMERTEGTRKYRNCNVRSYRARRWMWFFFFWNPWTVVSSSSVVTAEEFCMFLQLECVLDQWEMTSQGERIPHPDSTEPFALEKKNRKVIKSLNFTSPTPQRLICLSQVTLTGLSSNIWVFCEVHFQHLLFQQM